MAKSLRLALIVALAFHTFPVFAANNTDRAILDLLVQKGVVTEKDAARVQEQLKQDQASADEKLKLSPWVTEMKFSGDLRIRYQYDQRDPQHDPSAVGGGSDEDRSPTGSQRSRWRTRLRLRGDFKLGSSVYGGVQIGTGQAADADNQTYENGFSDYDIWISRAFVGWNATDWLTLVGGKQPNPLYWSELIWSTEISPTGFSESVKLDQAWHELLGGTAGRWALTMNLAQFIYDDNNEDLPDDDASTDAYIFAGQLVATCAVRENLKIIAAPGVMVFNAADLSGFVNENCFDNQPDVSGETRDLLILGLPGEVATRFGKVPVRFFWDFDWNAQGADRFTNVYHITSGHSAQDDIAWLLGIQAGKNTAAGDWMFTASWRQTGISATDPNLNDGDFALGELNTRGCKVSILYNLTQFANITLSYAHAWNLRDHLEGGEITTGGGVGDENGSDYFQADVNVKF